MKFLISVLGGLQMLGGIAVLITAASSIHEILGAVAFGLGVICLALGTVIDRLEALRPSTDAVEDNLQSSRNFDLTGTGGRGWSPQ